MVGVRLQYVECTGVVDSPDDPSKNMLFSVCKWLSDFLVVWCDSSHLPCMTRALCPLPTGSDRPQAIVSAAGPSSILRRHMLLLL